MHQPPTSDAREGNHPSVASQSNGRRPESVGIEHVAGAAAGRQTLVVGKRANLGALRGVDHNLLAKIDDDQLAVGREAAEPVAWALRQSHRSNKTPTRCVMHFNAADVGRAFRCLAHGKPLAVGRERKLENKAS